MKTYAVPVAYYISEEGSVTPEVYIQPAENPEQAQELVRSRIIDEEKETLADVDDLSAYTDEEIREMIPAIWVDGDDEPEEEGFIIAHLRNIIKL